jgi:hypothetical protein
LGTEVIRRARSAYEDRHDDRYDDDDYDRHHKARSKSRSRLTTGLAIVSFRIDLDPRSATNETTHRALLL